MGGYTAVWERQRSFDDDGKRRRPVKSLGEAQLVMQMAFMTEPGFRPGCIVDSSSRTFGFVLADPLRSDQEYLDRGFEFYEEWQLQPAADDGDWHLDHG